MIAQALTLFGAAHLGALMATGAGAAAISLLLRAGLLRVVLCRGLSLLLLGNAGFGQWTQISGGVWSVRHDLPLHLCSLGVYIAAAALWLAARRTPAAPGDAQQRCPKTQFFYEITYYWALGGGVQALLTPELRETFPSPAYFVFFIGHGGVLVAALALTLGLGMRPRGETFWRIWALTLGLAGGVLVFNLLTGANYMYLAGPPARASIYDYFGRWPYSILTLVAVGTLLFMLCYLPFWLLDRARTAPAALRMESHDAA